ncbi:MAG: hypothetical protein ABS67_02800 [Niabella sp. SCN 42-15]|nr:MAG: hypothetical protein ABS67_02800 [Niabella sp. SCN 42-15]
MFDDKSGEYIPVMITVFEYHREGNRIYSIEAVDIEKQNSAGQLESSPGGKQSPIAEFNAKIAKLLDDAKRNPLRFAMGVGGYYLPENKNELENRINYISEKTGISFTKSKNTNSWYGEYKGNKIRVSDHFSKFEEKNKNGKDFHFADSDNAIIKQIKGENPFSEYKKGDKITHSYAPIGEVIFVSNNHKEGYVQVIDKDGNTRKFDEGKFFGKEQGNIRFLSTPQGEVYGFVKDGKIYLDPAKLSPELIAEEYTHIQQQALRLAANNADRAAQKIVSAWDKATGRLADAIIKGMSAGGMSARAKALLKQMGIAESELASEVYQRQDGESAAAYKTRLQDELWAKAQKSSFAKYLETLAAENKLGVTTRELYEALKDFAKYIAKQLGIYNEKEWGRLTLPQLIERTNKELSSGKWLDKLEITTQDKAAEWSDNLQRANDRFNEELANFDNLPQGHVFQMGNAGAILQSTGVPDLPIELKAEKLKEKAASEKHPFDLPGAKDLPRAIQNPLAVFSYGDKNKAVNVITEIETNGKKMLVGISLNPTVQGKTLEINSVRNVFPKDTHEWVNWVNDGKGIYYDKEKLLSFLDQQRMNRSGQSPADVAFVLPDKQVKQENLEAATKIIKDFENPISDQGGRINFLLIQNVV